LNKEKQSILDLQHFGKDNFTTNEWKLINDYIKILKLVFDATKELSQEKVPTFSMVIPIVYSIETKLKNFIYYAKYKYNS